MREALRQAASAGLPGLVVTLVLLGCGQAEAPPPDLPSGGASAAAERPLVHEEIAGRWRKLRPERVDPDLSPEQRELVAQLEAIGYASGSTAAPSQSGVVRHDPARAFQGSNFYTSGHAPEAVLMDMDGKVLHRWRTAFLDAYPDYPKAWLSEGTDFWRRAHLFENGDLLAIFEGFGLIKVDKDSNLLWASPLRAHHDLEVTPEGDIYVLTRRGHMIPRLDPDKPVLEDFVSVLDADGNERRRVSLLEALEESAWSHLWTTGGQRALGDIFHTNSVALLDGRLAERLPAFRRGNVLVSMLVPSLIAVVDMDAERVVWAHAGGFKKQHDPKVLANGRLLLFDNRGLGAHSRVLEFDPERPDDFVWSYVGSEETPFFSFTCGAAERLPNGNTLVSESDAGRAFEVTPDGEIVWEYRNPHRAGDDGELVATLFEVVRLPPDFPTGWAEPPPES
ncbi:MAG: arylsulfotransferase family protein [Myxococcota bacterium]|nr:arylsulfotransferase family protein [Myxococcota bacterium]